MSQVDSGEIGAGAKESPIEPKVEKKNSEIKRSGTINKAKQLEEQKQNEKRKTLFGVRNPVIQPVDNSQNENGNGNNVDANEFNMGASSM